MYVVRLTDCRLPVRRDTNASAHALPLHDGCALPARPGKSAEVVLPATKTSPERESTARPSVGPFSAPLPPRYVACWMAVRSAFRRATKTSLSPARSGCAPPAVAGKSSEVV